MASGTQEWYRPAGPHQVPRSRLGGGRLVGVLLAVLVLGAIAWTVLGALLTPPAATPCTQRCGPTAGVPVPQPARYHSPAYGFDVFYTDPWKVVQQDARHVVFQTSNGQFEVSGQDAGKSDQQLVQEAIAGLPDSQFQSVTPVNSIRGAHLGFQNGAGVVFSATFLPEGGRAVKARIAVLVATKGRASVTAIGLDPWVPAAPNGIPESSQFDAALSQFQWAGQ